MSQQEQLIKAQETTAKINQLLEKSSQMIACGPICQKQKTSNDLKQKYLNAQTNLVTAPLQLDEAKRKYYVFTEGEPYYNRLVEEELQKEANELVNKLTDYINQIVYNAITINNLYNTTLLNSKNGDILLTNYNEQNDLIDNKITNMYGSILTNDRKTYYENEAIQKLESWYKLFWYIYYLLVLVFFISIFLVPSSYSYLTKISLFLIILFYPYYIHYIVGFIYYIYRETKRIIPKNVYNNL
jgi:hypothetical protein